MKKQGYLMLFVLFLLTFLSIVALYSLERLQLSTMIERNRRQDILTSAQERRALQTFFQESAQDLFSDFLLDYFKKPSKMPSAGPFTYPLETETGETIVAEAKVNADQQEIHWAIPTKTQHFQVIQRYRTLFDATSQNGGETLQSKFDFIKGAAQNVPYAQFQLEGVNAIRLQGQYWIIEKVHREFVEKPIEPDEPEESEPIADTESSVSETSEGDEMTEEDLSETEEPTEETETQIETYPSETEEGTITEPQEQEIEVIESREEIGRFHYQDTVLIQSGGDLTITHSSRMVLHCLLIHNGTINVKNVRLTGIVLHQGDVNEADKCDIVGYYETDTVANLSKVQSIWQPKTTYQVGAEIPGFFTYTMQQMR